jgi:hypothetical protein
MSYAQFFAIKSKLEKMGDSRTHNEIVSDFTSGRKSSMKDLTDGEYKSLVGQLNQFLQSIEGERPVINRDTEQRQRRKIIALFAKMGYTKGSKADMVRIEFWVKHYGLQKQDGKVSINHYHGADLTKLVSQVEAVYETYLTGLWQPTTKV